MSRKRLPTNVLLLKGTYRPHRHGPKNGPALLPPARPEPPEWLSETALAEWRRVVDVLAQMGVLTEADVGLLLAYVLLYADLVDLAKAGAPTDPAKVAQMRLAAAELGLTPSGRAKVNTFPRAPDNPFAELESD